MKKFITAVTCFIILVFSEEILSEVMNHLITSGSDSFSSDMPVLATTAVFVAVRIFEIAKDRMAVKAA